MLLEQFGGGDVWQLKVMLHALGYYRPGSPALERDTDWALYTPEAVAAVNAFRAAEKLAGPGGVRVNKAGCMDRCAGGPVAVVYPEAVWYTYVDESDIDEIVESHLRDGTPVERLRLPDA